MRLSVPVRPKDTIKVEVEITGKKETKKPAKKEKAAKGKTKEKADKKE